MNALIKEIFESIQGEGLFVGEKQVFVRFAGCNLNCAYCDTNFEEENSPILSCEEVFDKIKKTNSKTISLTGGEPLLQADFIKEFLVKYKKILDKRIYLETNGTLTDELFLVKDLVDIVAMDVKIQSATGQEGNYEQNEEFLKTAYTKTFIKTVFTKEIELWEIEVVSTLAKKYNVPLILQPKNPLDKADYLNIFNEFYKNYDKIRLIPQTHTFLGLP